MIPNSELGKETLKFSDSIKTILRNTLKNNLEGIWEIKVFGRIKSAVAREHYNRLGKFLRVSNDSISFFKNRKDLRSNNILSNQKIMFCVLESMFPHYADIIHANRKIWNYHVNENGEVLTITDSGELLSNGSRSEVFSHSSGPNGNRIK
jgi:hypothetical protein